MYNDYESTFTDADRLRLLVRLYAATVEALDNAAELLETQGPAAAAPALVRSKRFVIEVLDGLDLRYGTVPQEVHRLCLFALDSIDSGDPNRLSVAARTLEKLQEGFAEVAEKPAEFQVTNNGGPSQGSILNALV